jgi:hypothetical protein
LILITSVFTFRASSLLHQIVGHFSHTVPQNHPEISVPVLRNLLEIIFVLSAGYTINGQFLFGLLFFDVRMKFNKSKPDSRGNKEETELG